MERLDGDNLPFLVPRRNGVWAPPYVVHKIVYLYPIAHATVFGAQTARLGKRLRAQHRRGDCRRR